MHLGCNNDGQVTGSFLGIYCTQDCIEYGKGLVGNNRKCDEYDIWRLINMIERLMIDNL